MVLAATAARAVLGAAVGRDLVVLLIVSSLKVIQRKERYGIDSGIDPIRYITRDYACQPRPCFPADCACARPARRPRSSCCSRARATAILLNLSAGSG